MNYEKAVKAIKNNGNIRATRTAWNDNHKWICLAEPAFKIPTENIWNKHTKKQSENFNGEMNLMPYFIYCDKGDIYYGLDSLSEKDRKANDWRIV